MVDITRYLQTWSAVGDKAPNLESDVAHVQVLFQMAHIDVGPIDGRAGPKLAQAISSFQRDVMKTQVDGRVEPASQTFRALVDAAKAEIDARTRLPSATNHRAPLNDRDYQQAAVTLGCKMEAIKAVSEVESSGSPFLRSGKPKILFEPHKFGERTHHVYDKTFPEISRRAPLHRGRGVHDYGTYEDQWTSLRLAMLLSRAEAIKAASWGRFQILGTNWNHTGVSSMDAFLAGIFTSEKSQLLGFVAFVKSQHLAEPLKHLDWKAFARGYNGIKYYKQHYDEKIAHKYRELVAARSVAHR